jgi:hypothetical protein
MLNFSLQIGKNSYKFSELLIVKPLHRALKYSEALCGSYSQKTDVSIGLINSRCMLLYHIIEVEKAVKILRHLTHYELRLMTQMQQLKVFSIWSDYDPKSCSRRA